MNETIEALSYLFSYHYLLRDMIQFLHNIYLSILEEFVCPAFVHFLANCRALKTTYT
jgi:hypothetical protein